MFLLIPQYFTGLKLHKVRNLLIKATLSAPSKGGQNLNRCTITHLTSLLQEMGNTASVLENGSMEFRLSLADEQCLAEAASWQEL